MRFDRTEPSAVDVRAADLEVEYEGAAALIGELADPLLERLGRREKRPPLRRRTAMPGDVSSPGVLGRIVDWIDQRLDKPAKSRGTTQIGQ